MSTRKRRQLRFVSLFSGMGGFDLGLVNAAKERGIEVVCVGFSEVKPSAIAVFKHRFPSVEALGDITKLGEAALKALGRVDLVLAGFPCSNLSSTAMPNDRRGLDGPKSGLFWELVRVLQVLKPTYFAIENVASMDKRWRKAITETLEEKLCTRVGITMLNAGYFLPMRRARFFWTNFDTPTTEDAEKLPLPPPFVTLLEDVVHIDKDCHDKGIEALFGVRSYHNNKLRVSSSEHSDSTEVHSRTITASLSKGGTNAQAILLDWRYRMDANGFEGPLLRRLSALEAERLMGFPDNWTIAAYGEASRKDLVGNAISPPVAKFLFRTLMTCLSMCADCSFETVWMGEGSSPTKKGRDKDVREKNKPFRTCLVEPLPKGHTEWYQTMLSMQSCIGTLPANGAVSFLESMHPTTRPLARYFLSLFFSSERRKFLNSTHTPGTDQRRAFVRERFFSQVMPFFGPLLSFDVDDDPLMPFNGTKKAPYISRRGVVPPNKVGSDDGPSPLDQFDVQCLNDDDEDSDDEDATCTMNGRPRADIDDDDSDSDSEGVDIFIDCDPHHQHGRNNNNKHKDTGVEIVFMEEDNDDHDDEEGYDSDSDPCIF
jgi:DNA (cytosine-5)-methyltransferase 1